MPIKQPQDWSGGEKKINQAASLIDYDTLL